MRNFEIVIRRPPVEGNTEGISPSPAGNIATQKGGSVLPENRVGQTAKAAALKVATQSIQSVSQIYVANKTNEINVLSGSMQLAQRQQVTNTVISAGTNIVTSALSGAATGALFAGGAGAIGGALLGTLEGIVGQVMSKVADYTINKKQLQTEYTAEQQNVNYLRDRAGPYYSQSR